MRTALLFGIMAQLIAIGIQLNHQTEAGWAQVYWLKRAAIAAEKCE